MDSLFINTKRKKRKTRKCLDELRKRSRSTSIADKPNKKPPLFGEFSNMNGCKLNNNCITSKRLTLTMFTKAVRSETITRPLPSNIKQDSTLNLDLKSPVISPLNIIVDSKSSSGASTPKVCTGSDIPRQSDIEHFHHDSGNSSDSMILFSPLHKAKTRILKESANEETRSTITSTSRSVEDFGYHLYEELIEDIPLYLRRNLPNLIKEDVMNNTKTSLQNIYFENLQKQYEPNKSDEPFVKENRLTSDRSCTSNEMIVQNPMDYITIGWRRSYQQSCQDSSPSNADVSPPQTPHTLCSPVASPQLHSVLSYTPDYEYYPHRLNE